MVFKTVHAYVTWLFFIEYYFKFKLFSILTYPAHQIGTFFLVTCILYLLKVKIKLSFVTSTTSKPSLLSLLLRSVRQQPAVSGDVFRLRVNAAAGPADQQLYVSTTLFMAPPLNNNPHTCKVVLMIIAAFPHRDISGTKCDFSVQVQLRFCLSETSCPQEDHFPPNLCVKVNGKPCNLPVRSPG